MFTFYMLNINLILSATNFTVRPMSLIDRIMQTNNLLKAKIYCESILAMATIYMYY